MKTKCAQESKFVRGGWHRTSSLVAVSLLIGIVVSACNPAPPAEPATEAVPAQSAVERGQLLVTIGGCHDCHTPKILGPNGPEPDMDRMLMGHPEDDPVPEAYIPEAGSPWIIATTGGLTPWGGPWGVSFAANLTPDTLTGLRSGVWTEALFIEAMRTGKHMGTSRPILPPMPWPMIGQLSLGGHLKSGH